MPDQTTATEPSPNATHEVERDRWPAWCGRLTEEHAGRDLRLYFVDEALGEVRLADGIPFIAIDHDQLGSAVAFTVRYGDGVVPIRYVIAEPRVVQEAPASSGDGVDLVIEDSTRRKSFVEISQAG